MRRREFIAGLGGAAVTWALAARAQQGGRMRRIAFLHALAESDPEAQAHVAVFRQALAQLGWTERTVQIEHRFAAGDFAQKQAYVAEVVGSTPDVIITDSTPALAALKQATSTIPIVFSVNDSAAKGLVDIPVVRQWACDNALRRFSLALFACASLARPGGNITGFSYDDSPLPGKWLELLKKIAPSVKRITLMFNPQTAPYYPMFLREFAGEISTTAVRDEVEIEAAVSACAHSPGGGLIAATDPFLNAHRALIITLAERHRLPVIYGFQYVVREGGLISYSPDSLDIVRRSASYVDLILRGFKPADLPVEVPTKFHLILNLNTAKALGLTIPPTLLAIADEVIE